MSEKLTQKNIVGNKIETKLRYHPNDDSIALSLINSP